jgi:subtilisin family serine protease
MKKLLCLCLVVAAAITSAITFPAGSSGQKNKFRRALEPVPNSYIVVLNDDIVGRDATEPIVEAQARYLSVAYSGEVKHIYSSAIRGFSVRMTEADAERMSNEPSVLYVEEDSRVYPATTQANAPWGLDRMDQRSLPMDTNFSYQSTAGNVHAYVIDSGINYTHQEFGGRAVPGFDAIGDGRNGNDCFGHGTHVAGIIGGATYGVAKNVRLHSVRVLPCDGMGQTSDLVYGIDWVKNNRVNPAVANISIILGGDSSVLDTALTNAINSGVTFVVAAGNWNRDACLYSPARVPSAITVGASGDGDQRAPFSNFGPCVDVHAPGYNIPSAYIGSNTAVAVQHGTSMAAPAVAGSAALYLSSNPSSTPAQVANRVTTDATANILTGVDATTPNRLLYSWLGTSAPQPTPTPTPDPSPTPVSPGRVTIKKRVQNPNGGPASTQVFPYAATNLQPTSFALTDTQQVDDPNITNFGPSNSIQVTEATVTGYTLTAVSCVETAGGAPNQQNSTVDLANHRATIIVEAGESVECTFTSQPTVPTAGTAIVSGRLVNQRGQGMRNFDITLFDAATGVTRRTTTDSIGSYHFNDLPVTHFYVLTVVPPRKYVIQNNPRSFTLNDDLADLDFLVLR